MASISLWFDKSLHFKAWSCPISNRHFWKQLNWAPETVNICNLSLAPELWGHRITCAVPLNTLHEALPKRWINSLSFCLLLSPFSFLYILFAWRITTFGLCLCLCLHWATDTQRNTQQKHYLYSSLVNHLHDFKGRTKDMASTASIYPTPPLSHGSP